MVAMSPVNRDAIVQEHLGLVHHVARRLAHGLGCAVELNELVSAGTIGLIQAVHAFDDERGLSFSTFAVPRIRGAILDELRRQDRVPRSVRRRAREVLRARDVLAKVLGREATEAELSRCLRIPADALRRRELDAEGATLVPLDQPVGRPTRGAGCATLGETLRDDRAPGPDDSLAHEQEVARLRAAIATLREQERTVLALHFFEELKLRDIAAVLGLSVGRISQIRTAALARLRVSLSALRAA